MPAERSTFLALALWLFVVGCAALPMDVLAEPAGKAEIFAELRRLAQAEAAAQRTASVTPLRSAFQRPWLVVLALLVGTGMVLGMVLWIWTHYRARRARNESVDGPHADAPTNGPGHTAVHELTDFVERHPERVAGVLREWVSGADARGIESQTRDAALVLRALEQEAMRGVLAPLLDDAPGIRRLFESLDALACEPQQRVIASQASAVHRLLEAAGTTAQSNADSAMAAFVGVLPGPDAMALRGETYAAGSRKLRDLLLWPTSRGTHALASEHPQYAASLLAELPPYDAARLVAGMAGDARSVRLIRVAGLERLPRAAMDWLHRLTGESGFSESGRPERPTVRAPTSTAHLRPDATTPFCDGIKRCARILMALEPDIQSSTLREMTADAPDVALAVRSRMFEFDDLAELPSQRLQDVLREVDAAVVLRALQGAEPGVVSAFCGALSRRGAAALRQDLDEALLVADDEIQVARDELAVIARRLSEEARALSA